MLRYVHTYFILFRTLLLGLAIFAMHWQMAYILFFLAVGLILEALFILQKIYFNSDYIPYRPAGGWLLRIFPAIGEWLILVVTLLPPLLMLLIVSMAYLDEQMGENLYSLGAYFKNIAGKLYEETFVWCLLLTISYVVEHVVMLFNRRYHYLVFRSFIRTFLAANMILLPAAVLFTLMLHENEDVLQMRDTGLLFPVLIWLFKTFIDWIVLRWGYWLPSLKVTEWQVHRVETNQPASEKGLEG